MKKGEHGPDKLYDKFRVFRTKTGEELTNRGEFMFVLRPETNDVAAMEALLVYADRCRKAYPELSKNIMEQLRLIDDEVNLLMAEHPGMTEDEAYRFRSDNRPPAPMTIRRTRACPHCGAAEGAYCNELLAGKTCALEVGNG